ncbi:uncharacterized protein TRAVEDRAFT_45061 [Trametes versicolor FP-101664 SS1]|uniref:uncharacterized protein n=1 Tax=Trametes versicolor (strain FP-101664) TaxID=717944 RepID=UPI00046233C7|nr:uncharacterized protein TRAVEDRAFT_45061 [Trametes versicolor FP-101664 SS1]EIW62228.1 hypothetical protein TRAVEDRAFT_45061 [Trametes versicolor FP-101664 SS1]
MLIKPVLEPPARSPGVSPLDSAKPVGALQDSTSHNIPAAPPSFSQKTQVCDELQDNEDGVAFLDHLSVPTVILDAPVVTHTMAATLSLSLLGHTLFLKSQVPFPVAQLMRMPGGGSNAKVAKKREELLANFDTLSSHLRTTFVALSTAYAKCKLAKDKAAEVPGDENSQKVSRASSSTRSTQRGSAHLMFILGPSVGAARARILLTIDGLEVKVWGERADIPSPEDVDEYGEEDSVDTEGTDEGSEDSDDEDEDSDEDSDESGSEESSEEGELSESESDSASGPPASRSPSPDLPTRSLAPSPESPLILLKPLSVPPEQPPKPPPASAASTVTSTPPPTTIPPSGSASRQTSPVPAPALSYAEEQAALRAAERLLSRTLMTAWADGGGDMASELAPTQTHVYLRAPRRFAHPAWIARQNLSRTLDGVLDAHLLDAGACGTGDVGAKKKTRGVKTEGAWIGCRGGSAFAAEQARRAADRAKEQENETRDEEDEEIWWAWDGKIIGFADW